MDYIIDIKRLPNGEHIKEFQVKGDFFRSYGNDIIEDADLAVVAEIEKSTGLIKVNCRIAGSVVVECDRCLADLEIPVDISYPFTVKFSSYVEESEWQDDVLVLCSGETELNLNQLIYDYVCVNLPIQKVHEVGKCDKEMMDKLKEILK